MKIDTPLKLDELFQILERTQPSSRETGVWSVYHCAVGGCDDDVSFEITKRSRELFTETHGFYDPSNTDNLLEFDHATIDDQGTIEFFKDGKTIDRHGDGGLTKIGDTMFVYINHCHDNIQTYYRLDSLRLLLQ